jgi:hypothetical protein
LLEALQDEDFGWRNWITAEGEACLGWFVGQLEAWLDEPASDDEQTAQQCSGVALAKRYFECLGNKTWMPWAFRSSKVNTQKAPTTQQNCARTLTMPTKWPVTVGWSVDFCGASLGN